MSSKDKKKEKKIEVDKEQKEPLQGEQHGTSNYLAFVPPEGGWGWVVCFASFWTNGCVFGILNSFGIIFPKMLEIYGKGDPSIRFKTSWVGSLSIGMTFFTATIASIMTDKLGIRKTALAGAIISTTGLVASSFVEQLELLYLTYGILLGCGSSLVYTPSLIILGHYFKERLGLVNGFVTFGSAVFTIALPFLLKHALHTIGFQHTIHILAGIVATQILCALTWRPLIHHHTPSSEGRDFLSSESVYERMSDCMKWTRKFLNVRIWRNKGYIIWVIGIPVALFGYFIPFVHLIKFVQETLPDADGEALLMALGGTSGVSRLIAGKLADLECVNRVRMQQAAFAVLGVCTACIPFANNFWILLAIILVMGLCDGVFVCLIGPIAFDLVGPKCASQAVGFVLGIASIPLMFGPPIGGIMYDEFGSYDAAFWFAGCTPVVGAAIMFLIPRHEQHFPPVMEAQEFAAMAVVDSEDEDENEYLHSTYYIHSIASGGIWQTPLKNPSSSKYKDRTDDALVSNTNGNTLQVPMDPMMPRKVENDSKIPDTNSVKNGPKKSESVPLMSTDESEKETVVTHESVL